jgi:hypothetical protein
MKKLYRVIVSDLNNNKTIYYIYMIYLQDLTSSFSRNDMIININDKIIHIEIGQKLNLFGIEEPVSSIVNFQFSFYIHTPNHVIYAYETI